MIAGRDPRRSEWFWGIVGTSFALAAAPEGTSPITLASRALLYSIALLGLAVAIRRLTRHAGRPGKARVILMIGLLTILGGHPIDPSSVTPATVTNSGLAVSIGLTNLSVGELRDKSAVKARVDDVISVSLTYTNVSSPVVPIYGLYVQAELPKTPGPSQQLYGHFRTTGMDLKVAATIQLAPYMKRAYLEYVPDSIRWQHGHAGGEAEYRTDTLLPDILMSPQLLEDVQPGAPTATVSFLVRVRMAVNSIRMEARRPGITDWLSELVVEAGSYVEFRIDVRNEGNTTLRSAELQANLAPFLRYVPGSTIIHGSGLNGRVPVDDGIVDPADPTGSIGASQPAAGLRVGDLHPGDHITAEFMVVIDHAAKPSELRTVGSVRAVGQNEFYNVVVLNVETVAPGVTRRAPVVSAGEGWSDSDGGRATQRYVQGMAGAAFPRFNSFTGTPVYGDERAFLDAKPAHIDGSGGFLDQIRTSVGDRLMLRMHIHNNADSDRNGDDWSGVSVAINTRAILDIGTTDVEPASKAVVKGTVSADNARPRWVGDTVTLYSDRPFLLRPVPDSARIHSNAHPFPGLPLTGLVASSQLPGPGALLGYDRIDGKVPGCFAYSAVVTVLVDVIEPPRQMA